MRILLRTVFPLLAVLLTAGCGSHPDMPMAPSALGHGATLQGTVEAPVAASSADVGAFSAASGINVTVVGTSLSTTTDPTGRFVLQGVPAGSVTLRFQGHGVDATVQIAGLVDGQTLTITVQVAGSDAVLVPSPSNHIEFSGAIESVTPPRLVVAGRTVEVDSSTDIERAGTRISLKELRVGETVKVDGTIRTDRAVQARTIVAAAEQQNNDDEIDFTGAIKSITPPSLVVGSRTVVTDARTKFEGEGKVRSLTDLRVGDTVKVEGTLRPDGAVLARKIERKGGSDGGDDENDDNEDGEDGDS